MSFPYIGFLDREEETYKRTKDFLLSRKDPYYAEGDGFTGIG